MGVNHAIMLDVAGKERPGTKPRPYEITGLRISLSVNRARDVPEKKPVRRDSAHMVDVTGKERPGTKPRPYEIMVLGIGLSV